MADGASMKSRIISVALTIQLACASLFGQLSVKVDSIYAPSLGRVKKLAVLLPADYALSRRYPVLYLLHGNGGNCLQWLNDSHVKTYVQNRSLIVVMPDAESSFYVNSSTDPRNRFEDYIMVDLRQYVQKTYAVDTLRQAIAGVSMGGYGALMLAFKHPRRFVFAGDISGALDIPRYLDLREREAGLSRSLPNLKKVFGSGPSTFRRAHDLFSLYRTISPDSLPYLYLAMGIQDEYALRLRMHRAFVDSLNAAGIAYEYHETPGRHNWTYFDTELLPLIQKLDDVLKHGFRSAADAVAKTIGEKGVAAAVEQFRNMRNDVTGVYRINERDFNSLAYSLLNAKKMKEAIEVFKLAVDAFPNSSNVYTSLGEAYLTAGDTALAAEYYRKSVELDPSNQKGIEMLGRLLEK
jgi:putative tributyrin esterase